MVWVDAREVMQVQAFGLRERLARSCATQQNSSLALYDEWATSFACTLGWIEIYFGTH